MIAPMILFTASLATGAETPAQLASPPVVVDPDAPHAPRRATDDEYRNALVASLHRLAERGDAEALAALLSRHPELVNARLTFREPRKPGPTDRFTALHWAAGSGQAEAVKVLLSYKADVHAAAEVGWTPLHRAAAFGELRVVRLLVAAGAKPEARTDALPRRAVPSGPPNAPPLFSEPIPAYTASELARAGRHAAVVEYLEGLGKK